MGERGEAIRDARKLGVPKMLILGLQHMFAMFGATILVPILVNSYFVQACGEPLTTGLTVSVTLFGAGFGTLLSMCVPNSKCLHFWVHPSHFGRIFHSGKLKQWNVCIYGRK